MIISESHPRFERCKIHHNTKGLDTRLGVEVGAGVLMFDAGSGDFEECSNHDNATIDWDIERYGCQQLKR